MSNSMLVWGRYSKGNTEFCFWLHGQCCSTHINTFRHCQVFMQVLGMQLLVNKKLQNEVCFNGRIEQIKLVCFFQAESSLNCAYHENMPSNLWGNLVITTEKAVEKYFHVSLCHCLLRALHLGVWVIGRKHRFPGSLVPSWMVGYYLNWEYSYFWLP